LALSSVPATTNLGVVHKHMVAYLDQQLVPTNVHKLKKERDARRRALFQRRSLQMAKSVGAISSDLEKDSVVVASSAEAISLEASPQVIVEVAAAIVEAQPQGRRALQPYL